ncbi:hypothetical protein DPMN_052045 [Dreissena polymorpha]|uniref:Uncharacterized protein n=1 Tax=Dreissena polymorpha TaxID=45954 RepID=A0A9D4CKP3_DREPO|nr:hypothetical protein DPMN_052045 [Dreissena polymorpha]
MAEAFFESEAVNSLGDLYAQGDVLPSAATTHSTPTTSADTSDLEELRPITATFRWPISAPTDTGRRAGLLTPPIINRNPNLRSRFFFVRHMNLQPTRAPVIS